MKKRVGEYLMDCLIGIIACIAIHEYFKLDKNSELKKISWVGYLIAIMIAAPVFIPAVIAVLGSSRVGGRGSVPILMDGLSPC